MLIGKRRCFYSIGVLWFCFLIKLLFFCGFTPLWEGYDEFAHFAFVQHLVFHHALPVLNKTNASQETADSLRLAPVPWTMRDWTPGWLTYEAFWSLPGPSRSQRERELRNIPHALGEREAADLRLHEAQQPPLAYFLYAIPYTVLKGSDLRTRAWAIRIAGAAMASLVIPLGFFLARRVFHDDLQALGVVAVVASMPELILLVDHGGNEPLAAVLGTACAFALTRITDPPSGSWESHLRALFLGVVFGCGLLAKAYFLALIPAIVVIYLSLAWCNPRFRRRIALQMLITFAAIAAIAGWWYWNAFRTTGSLTGEQLAMVAGKSSTSLMRAIQVMDWRRAADTVLLSHIWLGGYSFLVLRAWMYHTVEIVFLLSCAGLVFRFRRIGSARLAVCMALLFFFWIALAYQAVNTYRALGVPQVPGYYAYVLVVPEVVCLIAGLSAWMPRGRRFAAPVLVLMFSALEVYGTLFCLMPYYAGFTVHTPGGNVPAVHVGQLLNGGFRNLFGNLAVNKSDFLTPGALIVLFAAFLLAIAGVIAVSLQVALFREGGESGPGTPDRLIPLRSR